MKTVESMEQMQDNVNTIEGYLLKRVDPEYEFALNLIKKGTCFLAIKNEHGYNFYPSRFVGYIDNSRDQHLNNEYKDGRETNQAISRVINSKPKPDSNLNSEYMKYCEDLGFTARDKGSFGVERKFWQIGYEMIS